MATACAPPAAYTSSMPSSAHAARMVGCGQPSLSVCGGLTTAMDSTPATLAGTTFITTLDGYTARPPGTYNPTRRTGRHVCRTMAPGPSSVTPLAGNWSLCTRVVRSMAVSSALRTSGSRACSAAAITSAGTRNDAGRIPSKRSPAASTASAPPWRTWSMMCATAAAWPCGAARGTSNDCPVLRSMRASM